MTLHDERPIGIGGDDLERPAADATESDGLKRTCRHDHAVVLGQNIRKLGIAAVEGEAGDVFANGLQLHDLTREGRVKAVILERGRHVLGGHLGAVVKQHPFAQRDVPHVELAVSGLDLACQLKFPPKPLVHPGQAVPLQACIGVHNVVRVPSIAGICRAAVGRQLGVDQGSTALGCFLCEGLPDQAGIKRG